MEPYDPDDNRYPKMLYDREFAALHAVWSATMTGPEREKAYRVMVPHQRTVETPNEHEKWRAKGWRESPADHADVDPRVPAAEEKPAEEKPAEVEQPVAVTAPGKARSFAQR